MADNLYTANPESSVELSRLLRQDELLTKRVTRFFPDGIDPDTIHQVLDIGCGPGGWLINLARRFRHVEANGIDISEKMIGYANQYAELEQLPNVSFVCDTFLRLPFADESFDFLNARLVQWFIPEEKRELVLREWFRVLRPGGWLRLVEADYPQTNGQASELLASLFALALKQKFGPRPFPGIIYEILPAFLEEMGAEQRILLSMHPRRGSHFYISRLLQALKCEDIHTEPSLIDYSAQGNEREAFVQDVFLAFESQRDFLLASVPGLSRERYSSLITSATKEMEAPDFIGMQLYLSAWGRKPLI